MLADLDPTPLPSVADARPQTPPSVSLLVGAGICLVAAQLLGIYGLRTRKADFIFAVVMIALLAAAIVMGGEYAYHRVH